MQGERSTRASEQSRIGSTHETAGPLMATSEQAQTFQQKLESIYPSTQVRTFSVYRRGAGETGAESVAARLCGCQLPKLIHPLCVFGGGGVVMVVSKTSGCLNCMTRICLLLSNQRGKLHSKHTVAQTAC